MNDIPLADEFDSPQGEFAFYDAYASADRASIRAQRHVDIRSIRQGDKLATKAIVTAGQEPENGPAVLAYDTSVNQNSVVLPSENWSAGTVASDATRGNFRILSVALVAGLNTITSIMPQYPVDIDTGFDDNDFVSIALPAFPLASVTLGSSFVDLTSEPTGNFAVGPTASVGLGASAPALVNGDSEFRVPRAQFNVNGIDLSAITAIRFRIQATGAATLRVMAVRLLSKNWKYAAMDIDTRQSRLRRTPPPNGTLARPYDFTWPSIWRADDVPGDDDPRPIDLEVGAVFGTGAMSTTNQLTLFFREATKTYLTQLDLDGQTQDWIDGLGQQPDVGTYHYNARRQSDLSSFTQADLEGRTQSDLERTPSSASSSYLSAALQWSNTAATLGLTDSLGNGYNFTVNGLAANASYILLVRLRENSIRAIIYPLDNAGNLQTATPIFDSNQITDDNLVKRRKGRFGWFANLGDGDAYLEAIRPRSQVFAEYRSLPFRSMTPVEGAELYVSSSAPRSLWEGFDLATWSGVPSAYVEFDKSRTTSDGSYKVTTYGGAYQGVTSNVFNVVNLDELEIEFDLYVPNDFVQASAGQTRGPLRAFLHSPTDQLYELPLPALVPDQWQRIKITLPFSHSIQAGAYRFSLLQTVANVTATWWIDRVSITERAMRWGGRAVIDDPWGSNDAPWTPFGNIINRENGGVLFARRGNTLQVRGQALRQSARIDGPPKFKARYARLGRLTFASPAAYTAPTASFTYSTGANHALTVTSTATGGPIILQEWNFGDGAKAIGAVVTHNYATNGTYPVALTVTDSNGHKATTTTSITVI
jgi:hypothetical protein